MLKQADIAKFYSDVEALGFKFPVAAITKATGESKGNVSKILRRQLDPSESFLNRFYGQFPKSSEKVSGESDLSLKIIYELSESNRKFADAAVMREQNYKDTLDFLKAKQSEVGPPQAKPPVNDIKETLAAFESRQQAFLAALSLVASGKRYKSEVEASAALSKLVYDGPSHKK